MRLQLIKDGNGNNTGIFIPLNDWDTITQKHQDLKELINIEPIIKKKLSQLAGSLSKKSGEAMLKEIEESRDEWEERLNKQF